MKYHLALVCGIANKLHYAAPMPSNLMRHQNDFVRCNYRTWNKTSTDG